MDDDGIRVFRVRAGLATGLIRAPVYDDQGRPARQRWTPPWSNERDRFDDPTRFILVGVDCISRLRRRLELGLPVTGGNLLKASEGIILMEDAMNEARERAMEPPSMGGFDNGD